jgi:hypothetical protein
MQFTETLPRIVYSLEWELKQLSDKRFFMTRFSRDQQIFGVCLGVYYWRAPERDYRESERL